MTLIIGYFCTDLMLAPKNERMNKDPIHDASSDPSFPFEVGHDETTK